MKPNNLTFQGHGDNTPWPQMKKYRAIALVVVGNVAADVLTLSWAMGKHFPHPAVVACYALIFAQLGLSAFWLGVGGRYAVVRIATHIAIGGAAYLSLAALHDNRGQWIWLLTVQTVAIAGPLALGRAYGLRFQAANPACEEQAWQFTLKHVFVLTTACAVVLGLMRLAPRSLPFEDRVAEAFFIGAGFALMVLVAAWVALGYGRLLWKLLALPTVTLLVGVLLAAVDGSPQNVSVQCIVFGQMFVLAVSLWALRRCGYRLVRTTPE